LNLEYGDRIQLVKVDAEIEGNFDLLAQYDVKSIPTLVLLGAEGEVLDQVVGLQSEPFLRDWFDKHLENNGR
jgi:thioredoxin-like negative regulator of GroEL